jgi:hypothetical protein
MELVELDELQQAFRDKALEDRDVAAGVLLIKVAERRATLLGLNAPIGHAVQVIQHDPPNKPTSTERIAALIDRILTTFRLLGDWTRVSGVPTSKEYRHRWRRVSVPHDEPAINDNRLARHVVRVAASEKAHDASHVLGSFGSAERDKRGSPLPGFTGLPALDLAPLGVDLPPHWCIDRTGTDTIRSDPVCRQRLRRGAGNADNTGFTGCVMSHVRVTASVGGD